MASSNTNLSFLQGILCALDRWDALNIAINHGWGVASENLQVKLDIAKYLENVFISNQNIEINELEDLLDEILIENFETQADDGSLTKISKLLLQIYKDCILKKDFSGIEIMISQQYKTPIAQETIIEELPVKEEEIKNDLFNDSDMKEDNIISPMVNDQMDIDKDINNLDIDDSWSVIPPKNKKKSKSKKK